MTETIPCPKHGDQPARPVTQAGSAIAFLQCRRCWYWEFIFGVLAWPRRQR